MKRHFTNDEKRLFQSLLERAEMAVSMRDLVSLILVEEMDDGGMGSLRIYAPDNSEYKCVERQAAELQFLDDDKVVVLVSLNVNEDGFPCEIDIWKTNSAPLVSIPSTEMFMDVQYSKVLD